MALIWSGALAACGPVDPAPAEDVGPAPDDGTPVLDMGEDTEPPRPAVRFRAATFNVGRFFDVVCDSNNCGDANDYERAFSPAEFNFKVDQISAALDTLDADIVALQEVEKQECLDALLAENPEFTFGQVGEIGGTASLDVAIIGRGLTHLETRTHRAETELTLGDGRTERFARELLEVHFEKDGKRIVAFSAHFKAQRNDDPEWRLAEAVAARSIVEATAAEFPDAFVYLGGDLNDEPGTPPLEAMTAGDGLVLVTRELPASEAWTYAYIDNRIAIDHLLFAPNETGDVVAGSVEVVRDSSGALGGSDHAALRSEFAIWLD